MLLSVISFWLCDLCPQIIITLPYLPPPLAPPPSAPSPSLTLSISPFFDESNRAASPLNKSAKSESVSLTRSNGMRLSLFLRSTSAPCYYDGIIRTYQFTIATPVQLLILYSQMSQKLLIQTTIVISLQWGNLYDPVGTLLGPVCPYYRGVLLISQQVHFYYKAAVFGTED